MILWLPYWYWFWNDFMIFIIIGLLEMMSLMKWFLLLFWLKNKEFYDMNLKLWLNLVFTTFEILQEEFSLKNLSNGMDSGWMILENMNVISGKEKLTAIVRYEILVNDNRLLRRWYIEVSWDVTWDYVLLHEKFGNGILGCRWWEEKGYINVLGNELEGDIVNSEIPTSVETVF